MFGFIVKENKHFVMQTVNDFNLSRTVNNVTYEIKIEFTVSRVIFQQETKGEN